MRCASLCVGIVDYAHPTYGASIARLRYAATDALAFSAYLRSAFREASDAVPSHRTLTDSKAFLSGLEAEIGVVGAGDDLQIFVLYLAGHGEQGGRDGGWFCLHDADPSKPSLDGAALQRLLEPIRARHVFVVVDCCHAEALVRGTTYFASLGGQLSRRFIASARSSQRAWEDAWLGRSVLSDSFLHACSTGSPLQGPDGSVRVEGSLFGYLREQVPLKAWALKQGQVQEPVTGGVALAELELPTVDARAFGRPLTIAQTLRHRLRQILLRTAVATASLLVLTELAAYHIAADGSGRILVRPGFATTHALMPFSIAREVDTGWRISDLASDDSAGLDAIAQARLRGMQLHLDPNGLRPWFEAVSSHLKTSVRMRDRALTAGQAPPRLDEDVPPPLDEAVFLSALKSEPVGEIAGALYAAPDFESAPCGAKARQEVNFTITDVPDQAYGRDLLWQSLRVASHDAIATVLAQITRTGYRALHREGSEAAEVSVAELRRLAYSLAAMRAPIADNTVLGTRLLELLPTSCRAAAAVGVALFGSAALRTQVEMLLLADIALPDDDPRYGLLPHRSDLAAAALMLLAATGPLGKSTVESLAETIQRDDPQLERPSKVRQVMLRVALAQPLPSTFVERLLWLLNVPEESGSFTSLEALQLLSHNVRFLAPAPRKALVDWLNGNVWRYRTMSGVHEAIGLIDPFGNTDSAKIELLAGRLPAKTYFPLPSIGYRGETIIRAGDEKAAAALGLIGNTQVLPDIVVARLARYAMGRPDTENRVAIVSGIAWQWYGASIDLPGLLERLRRVAGDAETRRLEIEVACLRLVRLAPDGRGPLVQSLLSAWREEPEPEIRSALASLLARSSWPELDGMTRCRAE